ncbi:MAG: N-acetyl-gamma-glutamyl-phosphate reductase, partial [Candidatus Kapaibacterium sp.]
MIRAAVIGAAGYTGGELIRLLLSHPEVGEKGLVAVSSSSAGRPLAEVHPDLTGWTDLRCVETADHADVIFLCLGHGHSTRWIAEHPEHASTRIIDLSTDHRNTAVHADFIYGLPEVNRKLISLSPRIANPGCFATAIELALLPLAEAKQLGRTVVVHAITGSTGAGVQPSDTSHFSWRDSNVSTYKTFSHQHEAEIRQTLGNVDLHFVPVRGPFTRGIHASCVLPGRWNIDDVMELYRQRYADHHFVQIVGAEPSLKSVINTNMCHIGLVASESALSIVSVIDNLLKGASGQAVQNMNLMFGFEEIAG